MATNSEHGLCRFLGSVLPSSRTTSDVATGGLASWSDILLALPGPSLCTSARAWLQPSTCLLRPTWRRQQMRPSHSTSHMASLFRPDVFHGWGASLWWPCAVCVPFCHGGGPHDNQQHASSQPKYLNILVNTRLRWQGWARLRLTTSAGEMLHPI